jgi:aspartyl protease family protein
MRPLILAAILLSCVSAGAQTVSMSGRLGDKALLMIDGQPRTLGVGTTAQGVKLVSLTSDSAVIELGGRRSTLRIGETQVNAGRADADSGGGGGGRIVLPASSGGHFVAEGSINGKAVRFMVDTGATRVSLSAKDARRIGLNYQDATPGVVQTANGTVPAYPAKLRTVRIGDVQVYDVDALVTETDMPYVLLGNSFLTRFQMHRENDLMTLDKRP